MRHLNKWECWSSRRETGGGWKKVLKRTEDFFQKEGIWFVLSVHSRQDKKQRTEKENLLGDKKSFKVYK